MKQMYEPRNVEHETGHNAWAEADEAVFREMLDGVDGETRLYADDDPQLKNNAGKTGVYETVLSAPDLNAWQEITPGGLFMGACAYMLRLFCGQNDVLFFAGGSGSHDTGRNDTDQNDAGRNDAGQRDTCPDCAAAAYQPLDPSYPAGRLAFMMQDAACRLLIADESLLEKVPDYKSHLGRFYLTYF